MRNKPKDQEYEDFRTMLAMPTEFKSGFGWSTIAGLLFCGVVMIPGSIYLGLMTGGQLGPAAAWVTVILFMEISRRAMKPLNQQQLVILLHAAHVMMVGSMLFPGGPLAQLVFRSYLVGSDAVRDAGLLGAFPAWFAPAHDSEAILSRDLFHADWFIPILLMLFTLVVGLAKRYSLGYLFFRVTSDVEGLPFPLAPVQAQGAMALAESEESSTSEDLAHNVETEDITRPADELKGKRWRIFSLGAYIGIAFGIVQIGVPAITSLFLAKPVFLIPQPFWDTTTLTEGFLAAAPTGLAIDAGLFITGMVLPFWAVLGTFIAVMLTTVLNPILHAFGMLPTWQPGMDTVNTLFANEVDFWLSFKIGAALGIALISIFSTVRALRKASAERRVSKDKNVKKMWDPPVKGRGDYPLWIAVLLYTLASAALIGVSLILIPYSITIVVFLFIFAFIYNPLISYINARLLGIAGQTVDIPYTKEMAFMFSGAQGIEIWLAPIPLENYGHQTQAFRVNELTGVNFWSLIKTDVVALPLLFVLSLVFWAFIWKSDPVPGPLFPNAQVRWDLAAKQQVLVMSSTVDANKAWADTQLGQAIKPEVIGTGFAGIVGLFGVLSWAGLPVMMVYGLVRGFGEFPHLLIMEMIGALVARFYFKRKYGTKNFLRVIPIVLAGYMTGVGLLGMAAVATNLIRSAVSGAPF